MQTELREKVRIFKIIKKKSYKEIAKELNININSFYNWLNEHYELGEEKERVLQGILRQGKGASDDNFCKYKENKN